MNQILAAGLVLSVAIIAGHGAYNADKIADKIIDIVVKWIDKKLEVTP